jgi:hypothetical protein
VTNRARLFSAKLWVGSGLADEGASKRRSSLQVTKIHCLSDHHHSDIHIVGFGDVYINRTDFERSMSHLDRQCAD